MNTIIRQATVSDLSIITEIYKFYVDRTSATFEVTPPSFEEMQKRWSESNSSNMAYLVAENKSGIVGFASVKRYYGREAFLYSVENSVYVADSERGKGIGSLLLRRLVTDCTSKGYKQMVALVGGGESNPASIKLHLKNGFYTVGTLKNIGFKFGKCQDITILQRPLH